MANTPRKRTTEQLADNAAKQVIRRKKDKLKKKMAKDEEEARKAHELALKQEETKKIELELAIKREERAYQMEQNSNLRSRNTANQIEVARIQALGQNQEISMAQERQQFFSPKKTPSKTDPSPSPVTTPFTSSSKPTAVPTPSNLPFAYGQELWSYNTMDIFKIRINGPPSGSPDNLVYPIMALFPRVTMPMQVSVSLIFADEESARTAREVSQSIHPSGPAFVAAMMSSNSSGLGGAGISISSGIANSFSTGQNDNTNNLLNQNTNNSNTGFGGSISTNSFGSGPAANSFTGSGSGFAATGYGNGFVGQPSQGGFVSNGGFQPQSYMSPKAKAPPSFASSSIFGSQGRGSPAPSIANGQQQGFGSPTPSVWSNQSGWPSPSPSVFNNQHHGFGSPAPSLSAPAPAPLNLGSATASANNPQFSIGSPPASSGKKKGGRKTPADRVAQFKGMGAHDSSAVKKNSLRNKSKSFSRPDMDRSMKDSSSP